MWAQGGSSTERRTRVPASQHLRKGEMEVGWPAAGLSWAGGGKGEKGSWIARGKRAAGPGRGSWAGWTRREERGFSIFQIIFYFIFKTKLNYEPMQIQIEFQIYFLLK